MTNTMLNEFVEKILVHERDRKGSIETTQAVEVYFNFVGKYIPPVFRDVELTQEEQEALRKKKNSKTSATKPICAARPAVGSGSMRNAPGRRKRPRLTHRKPLSRRRI